MKSLRIVTLTVAAFLIFGLLLPLIHFVPSSRVYAVGQCEGNACSAVTITTNGVGKGYTIRNSSRNRRVRVTMRWTLGFQCLDPSDIDLNPGQSRNFGNGAFCNPYKANYL